MAQRKIAVIGAGAAGLVTARELRRHGHRATVFERGDTVGGVWVYSRETEDDPLGDTGNRIHSSLYASLRTNLPRDLMAFIDYPFDSAGGGSDDWPRFPGHACVREYLENFARAFDIIPFIRFGTQVVHVEHDDGWIVESVSGSTLRREHFDAVAVCSGHYSEPRVPVLPGVADFPGRLLHSHNYRDPGAFVGQRVALLGASASAADLCTEIAAVASAAYCCGAAFASLPANAGVAGNLHRLASIAALGPDGSIRLVDETVIDPVDVLMFCTGYHYRYPFLEPDVVQTEDNWVRPLYRDLVHADHPTLAFIGIPFRVVPFPLFELQAQWFARLQSGDFELPSRKARGEETAARIAALRAAGTRQRHFHQRSLDCYDYLDPLAAQAGLQALPGWHRELTAALMTHAAANPGTYRERALPHFEPTRVPTDSIG